MEPKKQAWITFKHDGKKVWSMTLDGTVEDEIAETKKLLAYGNGCNEDDITASLEYR